MFSLRRGTELGNVKFSQLKRETNPDRYVYIENVEKTCKKQLHIENKIVPLFSSSEAGDHCPVHILDQYFSRLPDEAFTNDVLFLQPLEKAPDDQTSPWFSTVPVSKHTLSEKLAKMRLLAGIERRITNHSLRATSATQMYEQCVPEKVIQERMGHQSLEALHVYERTSALPQ